MEDNLEKYFQNHLKGTPPEKEDWNTPSDHVFERAMQQIEAGNSEKKRPVWWMWSAIGMLFLSLAGVILYVYHLDRKVQSLDLPSNRKLAKVQTISAPAAYPPANNLTKEPMASDPTNLSLGKKSSLGHPVISGPANGSVSIVSVLHPPASSPSNNRENNTKGSLHSDEWSRVSPQKEEKAALPGMNKGSNIEAGHHRNWISLLALPSVYTPPLSKVQKHRIALPDSYATPEKPSLSSPWSLGLFMGPNWASAPMRGSKDGAFEKMEGDRKYMLSYSAGLELTYRPAGHWNIYLGVAYDRIKLWSRADVAGRYDKAGEVANADGDMESDMELEVPSSMGMIRAGIRVVRSPAQPVMQDQLIETSVELTHRLNYLSIPLGVGYDFPVSKAISITPMAGVSYSKVLGHRTSLQPTIKHDGMAMAKQVVIHSDLQWHPQLNYFLSLGVRYRLSRRLHFGARIRYFESVENNFEQQAMWTKMHGVGMMSGFILIL